MSVRAMVRTPALVNALLLGVLADLLLRVDGRPGLNALLWASAGVGVLVFLVRKRTEVASQETHGLVGAALGVTALLVVRDADALAVFSLLAAVVLLVLAAGHATSAWVRVAQPGDVGFAAVRVALLCVAGPFGWGRSTPVARGATRGALRTVIRGTVLAVPPLFLLSALLMAADPVFERTVSDLVFFDLESVLERVLPIALVAWFISGFLRAILVRDSEFMARLRVPQPALTAAEVTVALWVLNTLFIAFMLVQLRYLFGGADLVAVSAELSYADYARRGFFELVAAVALVVPILLLADWAAAPHDVRAQTRLRATMLLLVVLLFGVIASAAYRMRLYQAAYGLTELRLYVSVSIVALTAVLAWLVFTVLRGKRERFAVGVLVTGVVSLVVLHAVNPHALIARVNIDRAASGAQYDGAYLRALSADAVPTLLARFDRLPAAEQCNVGKLLVERWGGARRGGWRTWNLGDWRARRLVAARGGAVRCAGDVAGR